MPRLVLIGLLLGVSAVGLPPAPAPSVVAIVEPNADITCSAAAYAPTRLVTAAHCLHLQDHPVFILGDTGAVEATVLKVDTALDLALLSVPTGVTVTPLRLRRTPLATTGTDGLQGEHLVGTGFVYGVAPALSLVRQVLAEAFPTPLGPRLLVDGAFANGVSGGPLVDAQGALVSIMQGSVVGQGNAYFGLGPTPEALRTFLEDN